MSFNSTTPSSSSTVVKLIHASEIRRVTLPSVSFATLSERARELFSLAGALQFSYVDSDGDVITVGSDDDIVEALKQTNKLTVVRVATKSSETVKSIPNNAQPQVATSASSSTGTGTAAAAKNPFESFVDEIAGALKADKDVQELARNFGVSLEASLPEILAQVRASPLVSQLVNNNNAESDSDDDSDDDDDDNAAKDKTPAAKPQVVHNAFCDGCESKSRIVGLRFKCLQCPDFDFCEKCYVFKGETHPSTHTFVKITDVQPFGRPCGPFGRPCGPFAAFARGPHGCPAAAQGCPRFAGCGKPVTPQAPAAAPAPAPAATPVAAPVEPQQLYELEHVEKQGEVSLAPGQQFVKLIKIKNVSNEAFEAASLLYASGDRVGNVRVPIGKIGAGEERYVALDVEAPIDAAGKRLVSVYRLTRNVKQVVQGEPVVITIRVEKN